ncbi:MAG: hypothetical protein BMS9Abin13_455 [Patescibacteria group bacterium]|nr:MAG: hypothetical protein BMS9Abin13_455 [Patescibacteria group bacterium]
MPKKTIIITIVSVAVIGLATAGLLFWGVGEKPSLEGIRGSLPFGIGGEVIPAEAPDTTERTSVPVDSTGGAPSPKLIQIHSSAVAGAYSFEKASLEETGGSDTFIRYIERDVGHIFETNMESAAEERISNKTRLGIYEALWGEGGNSVIIRYLGDKSDTIRSFLIKLSTLEKLSVEESKEKPVTPEGVFLPQSIREIVVSNEDPERIFYLTDNNDVSIGTIYNLASGKKAQIFMSPFTQWLISWPNKNTITLTSKPSADTEGVMYFLNVQTERSTKILGGINGLTTLTSPDGDKVLYSESKRGGFTLHLYDEKENTSQILPLDTLPEKCIWSNKDTYMLYCAVATAINSGNYPDDWYQGLVSFSDDIWTINTETYATEKLISFKDASREELDGIKLLLSPDEKFLFFINKKDLSLWALALTEEVESL